MRPHSPRLPELISSRNARLVAARHLTKRSARRETGRFLVEGAQGVREALAADAALEVFATAAAMSRYPELTGDATEISEHDSATLSETVTPQGLVAVCRLEQPSGDEVLARSPRLLAFLVEPNDPGNLGTIIRTADAAGADGVLVDGGADPYNGKAVRASAGSLFHLPVVSSAAEDFLTGSGHAGMLALATTAQAERDLDAVTDDGTLARPTVWLFGTEAHGLPDSILRSVDVHVRIPVYGRAESLNLASAAAVCLYASARAQRNTRGGAV